MKNTKRSLRVFLCHASGDKPAVKVLYEKLVKDGFDVWLDKEKLIPGQNWQAEIAKAVKNSDIVLVCLSPRSITKEGFVQREIKFALDMAEEKPAETIFIIPTRLEECDVPERINTYQWVDLFSNGGYGWLLKALYVRAENLGISVKRKKKLIETTAESAGIINVFPSRYDKSSQKIALNILQKDLQRESSQILLAGISLGDYFLDRGILHKSLIRLLERTSNQFASLKVKVLLLHPKCEALKERARFEGGEEFFQLPNFFESTTFIETDGAVRIAKHLANKHQSLEVRLYRQTPSVFMMLTSRFAFIESYTYVSRGGSMPLLQIKKGAPVYNNYEKHFQKIWTLSEPIELYNPFQK